MKKTYIFAAALLLLAGCTVEIVEDKATDEWKTLHEVVYARVADEGTKTFIDTELNPMIRWSEGDEISVFASTVNEQYRFNGSEGDGFAAFEHVSGNTGMQTFFSVYAVYPYQAGTSYTNTGITVQIPEHQSYAPDSFGPGAAPMIAVCPASTDLQFDFKPICGYLKLNLWNPKGKRIKTVSLTAPNAKIAGEASIYYTATSAPQVTMGESATNCITIDCGAGVKLGTSASEATTFWFCIPPVTMPDGFSIEVIATDGSSFEKTTTRSRTITRNVINSMEALECELNVDFTGYDDLSVDATANCYIVSEAGQYRFKTVEGNSNVSVGDVACAEVLWESFGTSTAPSVGELVSGVDYAEDYITFTASGKKGNAVVAAKNDSGEILWSWHIWMTDQPEDQLFKNNLCAFMDRNLGATSATKDDVHALGLLYQWGRKDPFLGADETMSAKAASTITWPSYVSSNSYGTTSYAKAHPTTFIAPTTDNKDWLFTSVNSPNNSRWQSTKTKNDPCPSGYCVPSYSVWCKAFGISGEWKAGDYEPGSDVWFPKSGCLYYGALRYVGSEGQYWSCTPMMWNAYRMYHSSGYRVANYERGYACSVRCFKEGSDEIQVVDLSAAGTANSYIVSEAGNYKIQAVKGNSTESVGSVASAEVLWESFGTDETPSVGDLISEVSYVDGYITFTASDKKGNAVVAAKDSDGTILWSWHIWMTDQPEDQVYNNNAGTMMDRNLGATSATPGDVRALGLMYQWGRKDPFLGGASISYSLVFSQAKAASTISWPSSASSDESIGTISYSISHPTTFITGNSFNSDWSYTGTSSTDDTRWQSSKGLYDPCPPGYRVPNGGKSGVWSKAFGTSTSWSTASNWDSENMGMNFASTDKTLGKGTIWYPASGCLLGNSGNLSEVGTRYCGWSCTIYQFTTYYITFSDGGIVYPSNVNSRGRAAGFPVRCIRQ